MTDNNCGTCTQCCKSMGINRDDGSLLSIANEWCPLTEIGVGCRDYENRPSQCRGFKCMWLLTQSSEDPKGKFPAEARPDKSHIVLVPKHDGNTILAIVDPHRWDSYESGKMGGYLHWVGEKYPVVVVIGQIMRPLGSIASNLVHSECKRLGRDLSESELLNILGKFKEGLESPVP